MAKGQRKTGMDHRGDDKKKGLSIKEEKRKTKGQGGCRVRYRQWGGGGLQKKKKMEERWEWVDKVGQELKEAERGV